MVRLSTFDYFAIKLKVNFIKIIFGAARHLEKLFFFFIAIRIACIFNCFMILFLFCRRSPLAITVNAYITEPLAPMMAVAMPPQSTPAEHVLQWVAFCRSSPSHMLLLLKSHNRSGLSADFSSALHGLSLLHP